MYILFFSYVYMLIALRPPFDRNGKAGNGPRHPGPSKTGNGPGPHTSGALSQAIQQAGDMGQPKQDTKRAKLCNFGTSWSYLEPSWSHLGLHKWRNRIVQYSLDFSSRLTRAHIKMSDARVTSVFVAS